MRKVAWLARLSNLENIEPKSPPKSKLLSSSSLGGVAVLVVEAVKALVLPYSSSLWNVGRGGTSGSCVGGGVWCFVFIPKENVRPARSRKLEVLDLVSGRGTSWFFRFPPRSSWVFAISADEGAVDALLCRDDVSVDVALVVFDAPLPLSRLASMATISTIQEERKGSYSQGSGLATFRNPWDKLGGVICFTHRLLFNPEKMLLSSTSNSELVGLCIRAPEVRASLTPPSKARGGGEGFRSRTRNEGVSGDC